MESDSNIYFGVGCNYSFFEIQSEIFLKILFKLGVVFESKLDEELAIWVVCQGGVNFFIEINFDDAKI